MSKSILWPIVALVAIGSTAATIMALAHVDQSIIALVLVGLIAPVLAALVTGRQEATTASVQAVQQQTNGNTGRLLDLVEKLGGQLAASTPPTSTPAAAQSDEQQAA